MTHKQLRALLDSQMQWCVHTLVAHLGVDIDMHTQQEHDRLHILHLDRIVQEVAAVTVVLQGRNRGS